MKIKEVYVMIVFFIVILFTSMVGVSAADNEKGVVPDEPILPTAICNYDSMSIDSVYMLSSELDEVHNILNTIEDDMTDVEKALTVHDYMALNYEYDYENYLNNTIPFVSYTKEGLLTYKTGVCQAYAETYEYIMNLLGIECITILSNSMNHAWNMIKIDGDWYHVDVTWDDPVYDRVGRVRHEFFLVSDDEIENREHYDWVSSKTADSTIYDDYFWRDVDSRIVCLENTMFYIDSDGIYKRSTMDNSSELIYNMDWETWGSENGGYWFGIFFRS